jgi:hypothetical protein
MTRYTKALLVVVLVASVGLVGVLSADAAGYYYYGSTIYRYYWTTTAQYNLAKAIAPYGYAANRAALVSMGGRNVTTSAYWLTIKFYYQVSNTLGYMNWGGHDINLNTYYTFSGAKWGGVLAHETSHILFFDYTKALNWNRSLLPYIDFLTESMAFYAGDMVYTYGNRYSASYVKTQLKSYAASNKFTVSFYGTGYYYRNGGQYFNQSWWQLHAQGYYFANGNTTAYYSRLSNLMYYLRYYAQWSGYYLRSSSFSTAQSYFEYSFYQAYGKRANAGWIYTGSTNGAYKNTAFLYGDFWYKWYN